MFSSCKEFALEAAKGSKIRFHDLRHTYAALMIEQGENIKYIQSQPGHSSPTVTWNVYAHLMKPTNQDAARRMEEKGFGDNLVTNGSSQEKKDPPKSAKSLISMVGGVGFEPTTSTV